MNLKEEENLDQGEEENIDHREEGQDNLDQEVGGEGKEKVSNDNIVSVSYTHLTLPTNREV